MKRTLISTLGFCFCLALSGATPASASGESGDESGGESAGVASEAPAEGADDDQAASSKKKAEAVPLPIYSPPKPVRGSYPRHLAGLGARSTGPPPVSFRLFALAPNHLGVSVQAQPTLYWYLEEDSEVSAQFTLFDGEASEPRLEIAFPAPLKAGYHAVRLADHKVELQVGRTYEWIVALVNGEPQVYPTISVGFIQRREPDAETQHALAAAGEAGAVQAYASHGLWYEAFDDASQRIASNPGDPAPWLQRAALLDQVGLTPVSAQAREHADQLR